MAPAGSGHGGMGGAVTEERRIGRVAPVKGGQFAGGSLQVRYSGREGQISSVKVFPLALAIV